MSLLTTVRTVPVVSIKWHMFSCLQATCFMYLFIDQISHQPSSIRLLDLSCLYHTRRSDMSLKTCLYKRSNIGFFFKPVRYVFIFQLNSGNWLKFNSFFIINFIFDSFFGCLFLVKMVFTLCKHCI